MVKLVDQNQADIGYPSPGVFSLGLTQGMPLVSAFQMGGADVFDFAFRKGEAPADIKGLEGKTIVLGSAGWQSIADPMLKAAGVDITKVKYVDAAGRPGARAGAGPGRCRAVVGRPARPVEGPGPRLRLYPRPELLEASRPTASSSARRISRTPAKKELYARYLQRLRHGLEFGHLNPRAATQIVMEQFPGLASQMTPAVVTESMMQLDALAHAKWEERQQKWGFHLMSSWQAYLRRRKRSARSPAIKAEDVVKNDLIDGANDFDAAKVKADADGFELSEE